MRIRMLQQVNSEFGTFHAGHVVDNLPDAVSSAWVAAGIAEVPVVAAAKGRQPLKDDPAKDDIILEDEPVTVVVDASAKQPARRRSAHPSAAAGPTWGDKA